MINNGNQRFEPNMVEVSISRSLKSIEELKEALKQVDAVDDELRLLQHLSDRIRELRELREQRILGV
jgi:hypothetical protein